ncbi:MAG: hypothetical protein AAB327_05080, partial [Actinomycetota bacterium]
MGGAHVFPGGGVDASDASAELAAHCEGLDDAEASRVLSLDRGGLAYWNAAVRECFEEAGVLLARHASNDEIVRFDTPDMVARFAQARGQIHDGSLTLTQLCAGENLRLITNSIQYVSHWITPVGETRRFDTRFFVARAPQAQEPLHDDGETIASLWVEPAEALARGKRGELAMIPPTTSNLEFLAHHQTATEALDAASRIGVPATILPRLRMDPEGKVIGIMLPGQPGYEDVSG